MGKTFTLNGVVYTVVQETEEFLIGVNANGNVRKVFK